MNFKKIRKKLKKLSFLMDSLEGEDNISLSEQDLLKSYLKEAYQEVAELEVNDEGRSNGIEESIAQSEIMMSEPSVLDLQPEASANEVTDIIGTMEEQHKESAVAEAVESVEEMIQIESAPSSTGSTVLEGDDSEERSDLDALFDESPMTELSDKLSMQPVNDLNKTMGINEKIFTIKELFGGDNDLYKRTINGLNGFHSFVEAKHFLKNGVAKTYDWAEPKKIKKATNFIKLVRRRYA